MNVLPFKRPDGTLTSVIGWYRWAALDGDNVEKMCMGYGDTGTGGHADTGELWD